MSGVRYCAADSLQTLETPPITMLELRCILKWKETVIFKLPLDSIPAIHMESWCLQARATIWWGETNHK